MDHASTICMVILAGGQSRRMGRNKATMMLGRERLIDRIISQYQSQVDHIVISASNDFGTGLFCIADDLDAPRGPVGAIFTIADKLPRQMPGLAGFCTAPVDAPFAPDDLVARLAGGERCAVATGPERIHPTFAYWRCDQVNSVRRAHDQGETAPSLQWLARKCNAKSIAWADESLFMNINTPEDLRLAETRK
ncbi:hypothetical protein MNBD_ALPHA04-1419 [hydrothermal vent metagenome]|uniref:MobA-like NTP transferase domain-containing protein n=1 Tax=hydrothermal vent metagenome TaxID=652676 RepID=A0A3B0SA75_9ZZZZ